MHGADRICKILLPSDTINTIDLFSWDPLSTWSNSHSYLVGWQGIGFYISLDDESKVWHITRYESQNALSSNHIWKRVGVHSSPKETQLSWSCLSLGEECRSVNFGPNLICTLLLATICQKPHSKIPHHSCTVMRHLSTSHCWNFTKLDASSKFESCLSFLGGVYVGKSGVIQHFHEFSWQQ